VRCCEHRSRDDGRDGAGERCLARVCCRKPASERAFPGRCSSNGKENLSIAQRIFTNAFAATTAPSRCISLILDRWIDLPLASGDPFSRKRLAEPLCELA